MSELRCEECNKDFTSKEGLDMHNHAKHIKASDKKGFSNTQKRKIRNWSIFILIAIIIIGGILFLILNVKTLPPTTMQGHIEENPSSHVLREPMLLVVQKHMLEHADGDNIPGVILNYNCIDYECDGDLIPNLESFAEKYPINVYIAPFPKMDAKIALTKLGRIELLDNYDEEAIEDFITTR